MLLFSLILNYDVLAYPILGPLADMSKEIPYEEVNGQQVLSIFAIIVVPTE